MSPGQDGFEPARAEALELPGPEEDSVDASLLVSCTPSTPSTPLVVSVPHVALAYLTVKILGLFHPVCVDTIAATRAGAAALRCILVCPTTVTAKGRYGENEKHDVQVDGRTWERI